MHSNTILCCLVAAMGMQQDIAAAQSVDKPADNFPSRPATEE